MLFMDRLFQSDFDRFMELKSSVNNESDKK